MFVEEWSAFLERTGLDSAGAQSEEESAGMREKMCVNAHDMGRKTRKV